LWGLRRLFFLVGVELALHSHIWLLHFLLGRRFLFHYLLFFGLGLRRSLVRIGGIFTAHKCVYDLHKDGLLSSLGFEAHLLLELRFVYFLLFVDVDFRAEDVFRIFKLIKL
jgi:hypothetical protein